MAGHSFFNETLKNSNNEAYPASITAPNHNLASFTTSAIPTVIIDSRNTAYSPVITPYIAALGRRQNVNDQDVSNAVAAAVNRATVEISRTIIALNATFAQQLAAASASASAGIKAANVSAVSTINFVMRNADIVTSSASANVTSAQIGLTSAQVALTSATISLSSALSEFTSASIGSSSISAASISDASRLSSSLADLQTGLSSAQVSILSTGMMLHKKHTNSNSKSPLEILLRSSNRLPS